MDMAWREHPNIISYANITLWNDYTNLGDHILVTALDGIDAECSEQ